MLDNNVLIKVKNRAQGNVVYTIPEMSNLRRVFSTGEVKTVTMEELRKLSWLPGGASLIKDCLIIYNDEAIQELVPGAEPEYRYDTEDVEKLLKEGSLDELKDALDFAPVGVIDLIKDIAVSIKLNDVSKRDAIKDMTGFDVSKAIEINKEAMEADGKAEVKARRVNVNTGATTEGAPQRRAATPSFSIKKN